MTRVEALPASSGLGLDPVSLSILSGTGAPAGFLPPLPRTDAEVRAAVDARRARGALRSGLAEALASRQRELGLGPAAEAAARSLADPRAVVVVTGQQPGLLAGPMLALHKTAGALALARRFEKVAGSPVVPAFWVASEDHDWNEVNRAAVIDRSGAPAHLSLAVSGDGRSVRDVAVPPEAAREFAGRLAAALPATERGAAAVALSELPAGTDLGTWFGVLFGRLLGDAGLVVVEPHVVAPWAGPAYALLVRNAERVSAAVSAAGGDLEAKGVAAPLSPAANSGPLFLRAEPGGPRRRVSFEGDAVLVKGVRSALTREALADLVEREPSLASGDVVGRVFVQDVVLPVVLQVAGPTELAYLAQVRRAFEALALPFPLAAPRPSATWVDARTDETVAAAGLSYADALAGKDPAPCADVADPRAERLAKAREEVERLRAEAGAADVPGLSRALTQAMAALAAAEAACREWAARREGVDRSRWRRAATVLRPGGAPQERVLSPISIVARHGVEALREGLLALDPLAPAHQIVHLE